MYLPICDYVCVKLHNTYAYKHDISIKTEDISLYALSCPYNKGIDHGRDGVTGTTPEWFVVRRRDVPRAQLEGRPRRTTNHEGVVAVTPDRPWSIPIITWLNNVVWNVFTTKYAQNNHQIERRRLLASIVTSRISP